MINKYKLENILTPEQLLQNLSNTLRENNNLNQEYGNPQLR